MYYAHVKVWSSYFWLVIFWVEVDALYSWYKIAEPVSPLSTNLCSWKEYYEWRCIPLHSPVALLLHWVWCACQWFVGNRNLYAIEACLLCVYTVSTFLVWKCFKYVFGGIVRDLNIRLKEFWIVTVVCLAAYFCIWDYIFLIFCSWIWANTSQLLCFDFSFISILFLDMHNLIQILPFQVQM